MAVAAPLDRDADDRDDAELDLVDTVAELRDAHGAAVTYGQLYKACLNNAIPASRVRGRWRLRRADLPRVAAALAGPRRRGDPTGSLTAAA